MDSKLLRMSAEMIAVELTHIFNLSIQTGIVPTDWKLARVTPVYKGKGDDTDPGNYRPISVVGHVAKLMEKEIQVQFVNYLKKYNFISYDQSAYLENHSTQTSLHRVVDDWLENMNEGFFTGVCFLDIQKCFDTIDHDLLLQKLQCYGVNGKEYQWFKSYLEDRQQTV